MGKTLKEDMLIAGKYNGYEELVEKSRDEVVQWILKFLESYKSGVGANSLYIQGLWDGQHLLASALKDYLK